MKDKKEELSDCFVYDSILLTSLKDEIEFNSNSDSEGFPYLPKDEIPALIAWLKYHYEK